MIFAGIDVGSATLVVTRIVANDRRHRRTFANTRSGRTQLVKWLQHDSPCVRVALEATGVYSLAISHTLHHTGGVEIMVVNPRAIKAFASAQMRRAKTDAVDAEVIADYAQRMAFKPWVPPTPEAQELQALMRRVAQLKQQLVNEKNRGHADAYRDLDVSWVNEDIEAHLEFLTSRIEALRKRARQCVQRHPVLAQAYRLLCTIKGVSDASALAILGELACLPDDLAAKQWVAYAGLDPRPHQSGTSINAPARISKAGNRYLRTALFMPALVATQHDPNVKAFRDKLITKGKKPIQAIIAVMRKLLLAIYGMFKHQLPWNGQAFFVIKPEIA